MFEKGDNISITYVCGETENHNPYTETLRNCVVEEFDNGFLKVRHIIKPTYIRVNDELQDKEKVSEYIFNIRSPIFAFACKNE